MYMKTKPYVVYVKGAWIVKCGSLSVISNADAQIQTMTFSNEKKTALERQISLPLWTKSTPAPKEVFATTNKSHLHGSSPTKSTANKSILKQSWKVFMCRRSLTIGHSDLCDCKQNWH